MHESLVVTSNLLVTELEAAQYLTDRGLTEEQEKLVAITYAAGFVQLYHLHRELLIHAFDQEMADAAAGIKV